jgi:hypothetical protein
MKGTKQYRHKNNPKEQEFHDKFIEMFNRDNSARKTLSAIVNGWFDHRQHQPEKWLSEKEETICINLIQWLGSPVGQGFLRDCGFELKEKIINFKTKEK